VTPFKCLEDSGMVYHAQFPDHALRWMCFPWCRSQKSTPLWNAGKQHGCFQDSY